MDTKVRRKTCFVVGPIGDSGSPIRGHADWLLDEIIAPVFEEHFKDFEVIRSDKITQPGMIDSQVINNLLDADLVIADMSLLNANAFYEMGLRHMERKPIIHMFRAGEAIPFDVKPYRAIPFAFEHPKQRFEAREHLKRAVEAVLASGYQVENPVTRARGYAELSRHAMPGMDVVLAELDTLRAHLRSVEQTALLAQASALRAQGSPPFPVLEAFRPRALKVDHASAAVASLFGTDESAKARNEALAGRFGLPPDEANGGKEPA